MYSSHSYAMVVFIALGAFVVVLRWAYSGRPDSLLSRRPRTGTVDEYGLMSPLAAPKDVAEGAEIGAQLQQAGIRSRVVPTAEGLRVMVWTEDLSRAREVLLG
ncbi:hypothetical protein [Sporichthya sp.]|uniref:hypothetical protein n=1 Tax=Sporichthya sp. TaxID=65475 RepID=UPI0017CDC608|nr:hypothetical protein [Sporichthya sp.]MBA3744888.1 hypothetical protein [Sporichthya sp.]